MPLSVQDLARSIDYTLFAAEASRADIEKLCAEARANSYHAACVNGSRVELARALLDDSEVQVAALIGFPLGAGDADAKRFEVETAVDHGAQELEVVINIGRLKDGDHQYVLRELRDLAEAADERPVKAVLETHLLTRDEKILACQLALDSGAQLVATATDFYSPAITVEEINFLRETLGAAFGLKAVGAIRDAQTALKLLEAGATRIGVMAGADWLIGGNPAQ